MDQSALTKIADLARQLRQELISHVEKHHAHPKGPNDMAWHHVSDMMGMTHEIEKHARPDTLDPVQTESMVTPGAHPEQTAQEYHGLGMSGHSAFQKYHQSVMAMAPDDRKEIARRVNDIVQMHGHSPTEPGHKFLMHHFLQSHGHSLPESSMIEARYELNHPAFFQSDTHNDLFYSVQHDDPAKRAADQSILKQANDLVKGKGEQKPEPKSGVADWDMKIQAGESTVSESVRDVLKRLLGE
jgi:hypothetical protein